MKSLIVLLFILPPLAAADAQVVNYASAKVRHTMKTLFDHRYLFETEWGAICPAAFLIEESSPIEGDRFLTLAIDFDGAYTNLFKASLATLGLSQAERDKVEVADFDRDPSGDHSYLIDVQANEVTVVRPVFRGRKKTDHFTRAYLRAGHLFLKSWTVDFRARGSYEGANGYFAVGKKVYLPALTLEAKPGSESTLNHLLNLAEKGSCQSFFAVP